MGQEKKSHKGSVSIINAEGRIRLRWRHQSQRYSLNLFSFTKSNLLQARKLALQIEHDMVTGLFDSTLRAYKPAVQVESYAEPTSIVQHFQEWVKNYRNMDCEKDIDYNSTRNMMLRWGVVNTSNIVRHFNNETFGAKTYNRRLGLLNAFFKWLVKSKIVCKIDMALTVNIFDNESKRKNHQSLQLMASNVFLMPFSYGTRCQRPLHTHQSCARGEGNQFILLYIKYSLTL